MSGVEDITNKLWKVQHLQHRVVGISGIAQIHHECAIVADNGSKIAAISLEFLGLEPLVQAEAEWKLAEHVAEAHNTWLAMKGQPVLERKPREELTSVAERLTNGNRGKWFTDGTRDVKAKDCPPGFRPGRSGAFKRKSVGHEEAPQAQDAQSQEPQHQVQAESVGAEDRVQAVPFSQTGEGWYRP